MTVAYDTASFNTSTFTTDTSWTHTPVGTPRCVIVLVFDYTYTGGDVISGVTYGGVAMTQMALSPVNFTMGSEADSRIFAYFLGTGIPSGAQTVLIDVGPGGFAVGAKAAAITCTAAGDTTVEDTSTNESTTGTTAPSVALTIATESLCFGALIDAADTVAEITNDAGFTGIGTIDFGNECGVWSRANAVTSSNQTVSWTTSTSKEFGAFGVAIKEIAGAGVWTPSVMSPYASYDNSLLTSLTDAGSGHCSQQNDLSGNARHRTQATDAQRPQMNTRTVNRRHVLDYDGVDDNLSVTGLTFANPYTVLGAYVLDTLTANRSIVDTVAGGDGILVTLDADGDQWHMINGASDADTAHAPTAGVVVAFVAVFNGAASAFYEDRVQYGGTLNTGTVAGTRIRTGNQGGNQLDGAELELHFVLGVIAAADRTNWFDYIDWKWRGSTHPARRRNKIPTLALRGGF